MTELKRLPVLAPRASNLETCAFCPKLCRGACPVSNAERTETVTPWAKMSAAWFAARGDLAFDRDLAALAFACTGCGACRSACDHENDVARVLGEVRVEALREGLLPEGAERVVREWDQRAAEHASRVEALERDLEPKAGLARAHVVLFAGCGYVRDDPDAVRDAAFVLGRLLDAPVRLARGCCGRPLHDAGAIRSFAAMADRTGRELDAALRSGASRVVSLEPGCHRALVELAPRVGVRPPALDLFVDVALARLGRVPRGEPSGAPLRWLDPCELGRHLGRFDPPRALLERVSGRAPLEAQRNRAAAECSGAGGLLPVTRPATSAAIGAARAAEHAGDDATLVTGCSQAARRLRASGAHPVDLVHVIASAMRRADGGERV